MALGASGTPVHLYTFTPLHVCDLIRRSFVQVSVMPHSHSADSWTDPLFAEYNLHRCPMTAAIIAQWPGSPMIAANR